MPVALEGDDDVDEMLEDPRAGNRAVLGHVTDQKHRHTALLGDLDDRGGDLAPLILPGDVVEPVRGGMVKFVENMEASLSVPTATSVREIPVRALEENRALVNRHRTATSASKISFTHIIAWAMIKALDTFPRLNDAYAELDGKPHRIHRGDVRLGVAVDVQRHGLQVGADAVDGCWGEAVF